MEVGQKRREAALLLSALRCSGNEEVNWERCYPACRLRVRVGGDLRDFLGREQREREGVGKERKSGWKGSREAHDVAKSMLLMRSSP
ncbi:hypothetical protein BRADI_3g16296v3 [Brachypodium distachyon]|uniref:Uncharacterized protein n=1 Tax=Brachypodium distachyon TaxID=15368 RepID=A0A0Q3I3X9_BRADI|nr:hypothetical protein BRADI_3g16296v3 [Brachypodium distachyon]